MTIPPSSNTPQATWSPSTTVTPEKTVTKQAVKAAPDSQGARGPEQNTDVFRPMHARILRDALLAGPPIRPDKVAYAKQLLSDPNYPSSDQLKHLATMLVADSARGAKAE
jgi:hypothetical protein